MREQTPFSKLPIGQKAAWIIGLIVMTILAVNALDGDDTPSTSDRVDTVAQRACSAISDALAEYEAEGNATRGVLVASAILDEAAADLNDPTKLAEVGGRMREDCPDVYVVMAKVPSSTAGAMFRDE